MPAAAVRAVAESSMNRSRDCDRLTSNSRAIALRTAGSSAAIRSRSSWVISRTVTGSEATTSATRGAVVKYSRPPRVVAAGRKVTNSRPAAWLTKTSSCPARITQNESSCSPWWHSTVPGG